MLYMQIELTDTFCGEANYSWVKRRENVQFREDAKDAEIKRITKREIGLSGVKGKWTSFGDMLEFRPYGVCQVLFVTFGKEGK